MDTVDTRTEIGNQAGPLRGMRYMMRTANT